MFDLSGSEPCTPRHKDPETGKLISSQKVEPEEWKNSFGMNFTDHEASQKIDLSQGFVTTGADDASLVTAEITRGEIRKRKRLPAQGNKP